MRTPLSRIDRPPSAVRDRPGPRRGFSMLELEVSFAAFAIILAGLAPVVVAELKHVAKLESRFQASTASRPAAIYYYVIPRPEPWARKLAGTASVTTTAPSGPATTPPVAHYSVTVTSLEASPTVEDATATVLVTPVSP